MIYEYQDLETGEAFELEQSMKDDALTVRPCDCKRAPSGREKHPCGHRVKRLISAQRDAHLVSGDSGGWASAGYAKPEATRRAELTLGRKCHRKLS
jgi:predicted nucleic acid-binding Zn ribbon protein